MTGRELGSCRSGSSAAEFALVLPLLLLLLFGIIDGGRFMWAYNQSEKATQVGARVAVVTNVLSPGLASESYVGKTVAGVTLSQGDVIPGSALGEIACTSGGCSCTATPCPSSLGTLDSTTFDLIVQRMKYMKPDLQSANVTVTYRGSGLGFAGDPNGMEIAPMVTVTITGLSFRPLTTLMFATFTMPDLSATLTAEDSAGTQSN